jgi:hypothetical protein
MTKSIGLQVKTLDALSVGDDRKMSIPDLLPSQNHYLNSYMSVPVWQDHSRCFRKEARKTAETGGDFQGIPVIISRADT